MAVSLLRQISLTESRAEKPLAVTGPPLSEKTWKNEIPYRAVRMTMSDDAAILL
ncbi:hypothetical protein [Mesotoga sp. UBA6090]|uniref:hypothetical protein n=1 Tax=Mesotoga sp. UBA6090 TaxID=1946860 RepID=UPI0025F3CDA2|nr:hypothetical protein [Mesotoga sp. UBA6090]